MSVRSASRGSPAASSIRLALRTSSIVETNSANFVRWLGIEPREPVIGYAPRLRVRDAAFDPLRQALDEAEHRGHPVGLLHGLFEEQARRTPGAVALVLVAFFTYASWLTARYALAVDTEPMTTLPWRKSLVYWLAFAGFVAMAVRSAQVAWEDFRRGYSALEKPEAFDTPPGET